jgi:osmoprotectant transport system substrate-binding protein
MQRWAFRAFLSSILGLSLVVSACGSAGGGSPSSKGTITVGGFNFPESSILTYIYGGALKGDGFTVNYKPNLGNREIVAPALQRGDIDLYPGYTATDLESFWGKADNATASTDPKQTVDKLNTYLKAKGLIALDPSPANDQNAFAVTKGTADKFSLKKMSDLGSVAKDMILGGPPECPTRDFCEVGLKKVYGLTFKDFKALDPGGPLTIAALERGDIQIGLVFSSDGTVAAKGFVVLDDDKHLQKADDVVPIGRQKVLTSDATSVLNDVSKKLTTNDLLQMNKKTSVDKADPQELATSWLKSHGFKT